MAVSVEGGHSWAVHAGLDSRTLGIGVLGLLLAVALGWTSGRSAGPAAGVLASLAGLIPSTLLAVALERRSRNAAYEKRRQELLERFAPPRPTNDSEVSE